MTFLDISLVHVKYMTNTQLHPLQSAQDKVLSGQCRHQTQGAREHCQGNIDTSTFILSFIHSFILYTFIDCLVYYLVEREFLYSLAGGISQVLSWLLNRTG